METIVDVDYLVVGAGAMGMAFVDALTAAADVSVAIIDRRHGAGGPLARRLWVRAPPPGIRVLRRAVDAARRRQSADRRARNADCTNGPSAAQVCDYYGRALERLTATGKWSSMAAASTSAIAASCRC